MGLSAPEVCVTGIGLSTPLGPDPAAEIAAGRTAVERRPDLAGLPDDRSARLERIDLRPWLRRRKDRKLMARATQLALAAAGPAVARWTGDRESLGLFLGVGREQGDEGESEAALIAAQLGGRVRLDRVAGPCRDLYPPLLPLKTLPNMALAHISINLDIRGENGAWAGGPGAGMMALRAGIWAVAEGLCPAALVGGADSLASDGTIRDRYRVDGSPPPVGEAGVVLLVERAEDAAARAAPILGTLRVAPPGTSGEPPRHHESLGDCGAADGVLAVALALTARRASAVVAAGDSAHPPLAVESSVDPSCACYTPAEQGEMP